jgi:hypothetical protein
MATKAELMAGGLPGQSARGLGLDTIDVTTAPAGTTQATATPITSPLSAPLNAGNNTGLLLPLAENKAPYTVLNNGGNTLKVYPNGTGQINVGGAGVAFGVSANKAATFYPDGLNWLAVLSA